MKLLDNKLYFKLEEPLSRVTINHLFAKAVVDKKISGNVFVDDIVCPTTFYVVHPYGCLLYTSRCV